MNPPDHPPRSAFVTGGTGFLGLNLIALLIEAGWQVTALHRPSSDLKYLQRFGARLAVGSVEDEASLERAVPEGVDVLFHTAADTSYWSGHKARQTRTNVDGTRNVVAVARRRGVRRLVHTSTTGVYGLPAEPFDESAPRLALGSWFHYQHTKAQAEEEVRRGIDAGLDAVILNPANIIGPYDSHNWSRLIRMAVEGRLPRVPPGRGSFCHVVEAARAHVAAAAQGRTGENYILGGADASYVEVIQTLGEILGQKLNVGTAPAWALRGLGRFLDGLSRLTGREPFLTRETAIFVSASLIGRSDKAVRELGYRPVPLRAMLEDCYRWMLAEALLPGAPVTGERGQEG